MGAMLISDENSGVIPLNQATSAAAIDLHLDVLKLDAPKVHLSEGMFLTILILGP